MEPSDFSKLKPGRIIWGSVLDMNDRECGSHPLVVLTTPLENTPDSKFRVAGGSRNEPVADNEKFAIRVVGVPGPLGHPRTGLQANTWFYATWLRTFTVGEVEAFRKFFPASDFILFRQMIEAASI